MTRISKRFAAGLHAAAALTLLTAACGQQAKQPETKLAQKAEKLAAPEPKTVDSMAFAVQGEGSKVAFEMQAPFEKIDGQVPATAVSGEINVDLNDVSKSTGLVHVDISGLEIFQSKAEKEGEYGERGKVDMQNEHMRAWLEIGEDAPEEDKSKNSRVEFSITSIKDASTTNINAATGNDRKVTLTAVGDFLLHQRKSTKEVKLEVTFHYDADTPKSVDVTTVEPFNVGLKEHDVRPRSGFGKLAEKTLEALAPKVAQDAAVTVAFSAKPKA